MVTADAIAVPAATKTDPLTCLPRRARCPARFFWVRPAGAHSCGCKFRRKLITANEAKRNCEPMDKNRREGAAEQGERARNREALVIKARRRARIGDSSGSRGPAPMPFDKTRSANFPWPYCAGFVAPGSFEGFCKFRFPRLSCGSRRFPRMKILSGATPEDRAASRTFSMRAPELSFTFS